MRHEEDAEGQVGDQNGREQDQSAIVKGGSLQLDRVLHDGPRKNSLKVERLLRWEIAMARVVGREPGFL